MKIPIQKYNHVRYPARWLSNIHYFGISPSLINAKTRKITGKWCKIESDSGSIYRVVRFQPQFCAGKTGKIAQIAIDHDGLIMLLGDKPTNSILELKIRSVWIHEYILATLQHPDPTFRLASWLGILSLIISLFSLAISI